MNGKRGGIDFFLSAGIFKFLLGALVTVMLVTVVWGLWSFFGPQETAEAATKKAVEDMILKLQDIEDGQSVIAYGYVDKDAMIIGFDSNQPRLGGAMKKCGALSNSCICACKGDNCEKVLECKGWPISRISSIVKDGGQLKINGESSFTLRMSLSGTTLSMEELNPV